MTVRKENRDPYTKGEPKLELAKYYYWLHKQHMKDLFNLGEFKFGGRDSEEYKYYKKQVQKIIYSQLNKILESLHETGLTVTCECGASLDKREGYTTCQLCGGSGYRNSGYTKDAMAYAEGWTTDHNEMIRQCLEEEAEKHKKYVEQFQEA